MIFKGNKSVKSLKMGGYESIDRVYQGKDLIFPKARRVKTYENVEVNVSKCYPIKDEEYLCFEFGAYSHALNLNEIYNRISNAVTAASGQYVVADSIVMSDIGIKIKIIGSKLNDPFGMFDESKTVVYTLWTGNTDLLIFNERIYKE